MRLSCQCAHPSVRIDLIICFLSCSMLFLQRTLDGSMRPLFELMRLRGRESMMCTPRGDSWISDGANEQ